MDIKWALENVSKVGLGVVLALMVWYEVHEMNGTLVVVQQDLAICVHGLRN